MEKYNKLQITAYEVREDERAYFAHMADTLHTQIVYTPETLNENTIHLSKGSPGVTTLGQSNINGSILQEINALGVHCLATRTTGHNHIDLDAAKKNGIKICSARYEPNGVAEYTVMLILMSLRKYKQAMVRANVNDYSLPGLRGRELKDLTIGIIGTGKIGGKVIENLSGFGCKILAFDTLPKNIAKEKAEYVSLNELYERSDVISYHVPSLENTRQMINSEAIEIMKDGVVLVNCARGELMNTSDIIHGIESEKIGALALDVFENETGIYHLDRRSDIICNKDMAYLRQFPNVVMTQHIAFYTDAAVKSMVTCAMESIVSLLTTGKSENEVIDRN